MKRDALLAGAMMVILVLCPPGPAIGADSGVSRATLDNGLRVIVVRNTLAPVATTVMNYLVGSNEAPPGFPGTAHAQEHMMFRGSPGLTAGQLADVTASMGGMFNADTQQTVTQYFFTVPADDLDVALRIERIRMRGVIDSERLWQEERGAIEQEVAQDLSSPDYVFYTKLLATLFQGTPYAYTPLGTVASFDKTTAAMLQEFHETWYVPNNAIWIKRSSRSSRPRRPESRSLPSLPAGWNRSRPSTPSPSRCRSGRPRPCAGWKSPGPP